MAYDIQVMYVGTRAQIYTPVGVPLSVSACTGW